ncbi:hypothetical protein VB773_22470 [Haloarculaceae archaeon H-GB2-1]|nr:hypothetical protein [Haloarculaceae archaeon H-GB1-1]MEA5389482.1 hypothetical protein [Haloarculaceae archaeon H-GB11]MEA5410065.1 hypothetical protein [Haloarculaceae archaeon H-GB2-1]
MQSSKGDQFLRMARSLPVRTAVFTVGPLLVALAQLINAYVHGSDIFVVGVVAAMMVVFSVLATNYHLAGFHVSRLDGSYPAD